MDQDDIQNSAGPSTQSSLSTGREESNLPIQDSDELEATALKQVRRNYLRVTTHRHQTTQIETPKKPTKYGRLLIYNFKSFWRNQVSVTVDHECCRDHLALERTFLGYLRTSLALSVLGITVAQLFRLQHSPHPNAELGYYVLAKPLSCICQGAAIYVLIVGAVRTWRHQNSLVRGKATSGGIEIILLGGGVFLIVLMFFILLIAVSVEKADSSTDNQSLDLVSDEQIRMFGKGPERYQNR